MASSSRSKPTETPSADHAVPVEVETGDRRPEVQHDVTVVVPGAVVDLHRLLLGEPRRTPLDSGGRS